jgi:hypothetical protein|tara:strand:+ start:633 stop:2084 length:1452 start_codon:yes stop_codon:yes gene_type:complete
MNEKINKNPVTYEDWLNLGHVIIPTDQKKARVSWKKEDFSLTKEDWKNYHAKAQIALRLDKHIDLDVDNYVVGRFINHYLKSCGATYGRRNNPKSHYLWTGSCDFIQYTLPDVFKSYFEKFHHGATLCELRHGKERYTIVPESPYDNTGEKVEWETYEEIYEYNGNIKIDVGKIALSTALTILYAGSGHRDVYCTAIAGTLIKNTDWSAEQIDDFVYNIAIEANDTEAEKRKQKGTTGKKAEKIYGIPKLAEILNVDSKHISKLFSWVGVTNNKEVLQEQIGEITEYGSDRYFIKIYAMEDGKKVEKDITLEGLQLMKKSYFYAAVMKQAAVFLPYMKETDFETMMIAKFDTRNKSQDYDPESSEDVRFIGWFESFIDKYKAYSDKKELADFNMPYFNIKNNSLEFNLNKFDEFLADKRISLARVDLVLKCRSILKAKRYRGKYKDRSCSSYKIDNYHINKDNLIIEGEAQEIEERVITYEQA